MTDPDRFHLATAKGEKTLTIRALDTKRPILDMVATAALMVFAAVVVLFSDFGRSFHDDIPALAVFAFILFGMSLNIHGAWQRYEWVRFGFETLERKDGWVRYQKLQKDVVLNSEEFEVAEIELIGWQYKKSSKLFSSNSTGRTKRAPITMQYQDRPLQIIDDLQQQDATNVIEFIREGRWQA